MADLVQQKRGAARRNARLMHHFQMLRSRLESDFSPAALKRRAQLQGTALFWSWL